MDALLLEAQSLVWKAAGPWGPGGVKAAFNRAVRVVPLEPRRVKAFWYAEEGTRVRASELQILRRLEPEVLAEHLRWHDAERAIIADRLSYLESTRAPLANGGSVLDTVGADRTNGGRVVPQQVALPAVRRG